MTQSERADENLHLLKELFPGKLRLSLDEYAEFEKIGRANAAKHLRLSGCVYHQNTKGGKMWVFITDYAEHLAKCKNRNSSRLNWHGGQIREPAATYIPRKSRTQAARG